MNLSKPKVAILGVTGMLGNEVYRALKDKYDLLVTYRDEAKLQLLYDKHGQSVSCRAYKVDFKDLYQDYVNGFQGKLTGPNTDKLLDLLKDCEWAINAVGIIKPYSLDDPTMTMFINGALPHILSAAFGKKLIHIATDCVYDGSQDAPYDEKSPKRPVDLYGISKLLGEPTASLVLRTSIIGPELGKSQGGLLAWFLSQEGQQTKGFKNHLWNGITTLEFGKICDKIINGTVAHPGPGIYHILSSTVNKYEMVTKFKKIYKMNVDIESFDAPVAVDRRLATLSDFNQKLRVVSFDEMIDELILPVAISK